MEKKLGPRHKKKTSANVKVNSIALHTYLSCGVRNFNLNLGLGAYPLSVSYPVLSLAVALRSADHRFREGPRLAFLSTVWSRDSSSRQASDPGHLSVSPRGVSPV